MIQEIMPFISLGITLVTVVAFLMKIKATSDENAKSIKTLNESNIHAINRIEISFKEKLAEIGKRLDENDKWTDDVRIDVASIKEKLEQLNRMGQKVDTIYEMLLKGERR
ncbi:MAG: hypothetical protein LBP19_05270 [Treponema sp.]|jgi:uncharacterized protein YoxC|nr:hypothetical protein [Treponema sp.]